MTENTSVNSVLVVDDDPELLKLLKLRSREHPYDLILAESGEEGIEKLRKYSSTIKTIILDYHMEGMNGFEFLSELKQEDKYSLLPIIMHTGEKAEQVQRDSLKQGVFYHLVKPVDPDLLFKLVDSAIDNFNYREQLDFFRNERQKRIESSWNEHSWGDSAAFRLLLLTGKETTRRLEASLSESKFNLLIEEPEENLFRFIDQQQPDILIMDDNFFDQLDQDELLDIQNSPFFSSIAFGFLTTENKLRERLPFLKAGGQEIFPELLDKPDELANRLRNMVVEKKAIDSYLRGSYKDDLTGFTRRKYFLDYMKYHIENARSNAIPFSVITMDLDGFKRINDIYGSIVGDGVLKEAGRRIRLKLGPGQVAARMDGDEFAILYKTVNTPKDSWFLCEEIRREINIPFMIDNKKIDVRSSFGISHFPNDGIMPEKLLRTSEIALHQAKRSGRNHIHEYDNEFNININRYFSLENDLRKALQKGEFFLVYQPKIDMERKVVGAEALLRWDSPSRGVVQPFDFIPILEESGMIVEVGYWVLEEALGQTLRWEKEGLKDFAMSVNISPFQFKDTALSSMVSSILKKIPLDNGRIELEITETGTMDDVERSIQILKDIKSRGVKISMDDFGTGFSSLAKLSQFPLDVLKIDKSFIQGMGVDKYSGMTTKAIIDLARNLDLEVIAEGVETEDQFNRLSEMGCQVVQGFYFSKPLVADDFQKFLINHS